MIKDPLKILIVEDNESDYKLLERQINKIVESPIIVRVIYFKDYVKAFEALRPNIILSDYKLMDCDGLDILEYTVQKRQDITFLFITGTFQNEQLAENTILSGATGYILKKHMNTMSKKLLPYFKNAALLDKRQQFAPTQKKFLESIDDFIESAKKESYLHSQSCKQIRDYLDTLEK